MKIFFITACIFAFLVSPASADQNPKIYKDFYYGMPIAEVAKVSGATPCEEAELQGNLCIESVNFGGLEWGQVFLIEDDKLVSVMLAGEDSEDTFSTLTNVLKNSGYFMVMGVNGNSTIDTIALMSQGKDVLVNKAIEFFSQDYESMTCVFLENSLIKEVNKKVKTLNSLGTLLMNAPSDAREIEITRDNESMIIQFCLPLFTNHEMEEKVSQLKESF